MDDAAWVLQPAIDGKALVATLDKSLDANCRPCDIASADVVRYPGRKEQVQVKLSLAGMTAGTALTLDGVPVLSNGEARAESMVRLLFRGVVAPASDFSAERSWRSYVFGPALESDLQHVWPEIRFMKRDEAIRDVEAKASKSRQTVSLLGLTIDEDLATMGGPLAFLISMAFLFLHIRHIRSITEIAPELLRHYPWPLLFPGLGGQVAAMLLFIIIPGAALGSFLVRAWLSPQ